MNPKLRLSPIAHIPSLFPDGSVVALDVGLDGLVYIVTALESLDHMSEGQGGAIFPKTLPDRPQKYRVASLSQDQIGLDVVIEHERFNIHRVQPLGNDLLLTCARSYYRGTGNAEENGRVYARNGSFIHSLLLGDGIQSVQTTSEGIIWTSYFDEGIFGNLGWQDPIGASGLVAWDSAGNKLYEFEPTDGLDTMCDCYALNVESDEDVWCYYYTAFPLVHLRDGRIEAFWEMPISGSDAFAVSAGYALFSGGYQGRDIYHLFSLEPERRVEKVGQIELQDHHGNKLAPERVSGRAESISFLSDGNLYRVDIPAMLKALS